MSLLLHWVVLAVALWVAANVVPGVHVWPVAARCCSAPPCSAW